MADKISNSSKRLKEMMDKLSINQSSIVERTGITKSALSNYLHGTREPRQDQISKIADPYNINPTWLMGYDVPMYIESSNLESKELTKEENELVNMYRNFSDEERKQMVLMLAFLKEQSNKI